MPINKRANKVTKTRRIWVNKCRAGTQAISQVAIQVVSALVVTNQVEKAAQDKAALDKVDDTETRVTRDKNAKRFLFLSISHDCDPRSSSCVFMRGPSINWSFSVTD